MVLEPVNGAARNAECLSRPDVDLFSVDSPNQDSVDAIDRLFVMCVAMRRRRQALCTGDSELKGRDAAIRFVSGDQEAYGERPETDGFVRRIDVQVNGPTVRARWRLIAPCVSASHAFVGFSTRPRKRIVPDKFSRIANRNGRSTTTTRGGDGSALRYPTNTEVTAAASVPSSFTST